MTTIRQIEANRRNAMRSSGPRSEEGKRQSRRNALRHGLTAETLIGALEEAEDYTSFEAAVVADYDAQTAVERELVLRLASVLWRLRRALKIETGLFQMQAEQLNILNAQDVRISPAALGVSPSWSGLLKSVAPASSDEINNVKRQASSLATCFLRLANLPNFALDRLSRYEAALWRQAAQITFTLDRLNRAKCYGHKGREWWPR